MLLERSLFSDAPGSFVTSASPWRNDGGYEVLCASNELVCNENGGMPGALDRAGGVGKYQQERRVVVFAGGFWKLADQLAAG